MASKRPTADAVDLRDVREQMMHLSAIIAQQQERIEEQQEHVRRQQAELAALRARLDGARPVDAGVDGAAGARKGSVPPARRMRLVASTRRRLLASAGAMAAAATVALAAGEGKPAQAASLTDGNSLSAGLAVTAELPTVVNYDGTAGNANVIFLANDSTYTPSAGPSRPVPAIPTTAALAGWVGNGTTTGGTSGNLHGVFGYSEAFTGSGNSEINGFGVLGVSNNNNGGYGVSGYANVTNGVGVNGRASIGVGGFCPANGGPTGGDGTGVWGLALGNNAMGVYGQSSSGYGLVGSSGTGIDLSLQGTGRLQQFLQGAAGAPISGTYTIGEQIRDANGELWLCVQGGSPGQWVMASHAVYGYGGGATSYLSKPIRLLDTRSGATDALTNGGGPYTQGGSPYPVTIAGVNFNSVIVPASCAGAIGNVTAVAGSGGGGGYLALVPHGAGFSGTANLAYGAGQIVSNAFNVGLSGGQLDIIIGGNPTDVILDLFAVVA